MYKFWGKVRSDKKRGKEMGFPTANLNLSKKIPEGIYLSLAKTQNKKYPALTFIGKVRTFDEKKIMAETYILDLNKELYGIWLSVRLIKRIRANKKFSSSEELIEQMKKDEIKAKKYFNS